jgi:hypothetical protein
MSRLLLVAMLLAAACSKDNSPKGLCDRGCKKLLGCAQAADSEQDSCVQSCMAGTAPPQDKIERLEAMSCDELMTQAGSLLGGGGGGGAAAPASPACNADCRGCVGDNSSCYMAAGGANGIPCEPCCCAPGGSAPTWKTE